MNIRKGIATILRSIGVMFICIAEWINGTL